MHPESAQDRGLVLRLSHPEEMLGVRSVHFSRAGGWLFLGGGVYGKLGQKAGRVGRVGREGRDITNSLLFSWLPRRGKILVELDSRHRRKVILKV